MSEAAAGRGQADNRVMTGDTPDITVTAIHPSSAEGRAVLTAYYHDIVSRYHGREATADEVGAAMRAEPSDDLCPPGGLLLVVRRAGTVIGCAGLRLLPAGIGEVTRVFVVPDARRHGIGARLLRAAEEAAASARWSRSGSTLATISPRHGSFTNAAATARCPRSTMAASLTAGMRNRSAEPGHRRGGGGQIGSQGMDA